MDTKNLTTFVTFAKEGSYTRASGKLNYAISTLADHVAALEAELGVKLVESHGKKTVLTANGEAFLPYAKRILAEYHAAAERMSAISNPAGPLHVLATESLGLYRLAPILAEFSRLHPEIALSVTIEQPTAPLEKLRSHAGDIYFCFGLEPLSSPEFTAQPIYREPLVFFAYPKHPLTRRGIVRAEDLRYEKFILPSQDCFYRNAIGDRLQKSNVEMQVKLTLDSSSLIRQYVKLGYGISVLPLSVVQEDVDRGELSLLNWQGEQLICTAQAIILKKDWVSPNLRALLEYTLQALSEA